MSKPPILKPNEEHQASTEELIHQRHLQDLNRRLVPACVTAKDDVCTLHKNIWIEPAARYAPNLEHWKESEAINHSKKYNH